MVGRIGCLPAIVVLAAAVTQARPAALQTPAAESRAPVRWVASVADPVRALRPGDRVNVQLTAELDSGWHIYSLTPVPQGPAATIVGLPAGQPFALAGEITEPLPQTKYDPNFDRDTLVLRGCGDVRPARESRRRRQARHTVRQHRRQLSGLRQPHLSAAGARHRFGAVDDQGRVSGPDCYGVPPPRWTAR